MPDPEQPRPAGEPPPGPRDVTIYDVARAAGVAASTVSRAFSRPGRVNAATAARIRRTAEELGYRTNPLARALATSRSSMIALVVSDVTNPVYAEIIRGAQEAAGPAGYTLLLADAQESDRVERTSLDRALPVVDGVLLAGSRMPDAAIRLIASRTPVVVLNRVVVDVPCVVPDTAEACRRALEHLARLGHGAVVYVAGPEASWADGMRWRSLVEAAPGAGVAVRRIGPFSPDVPGGARAAARVAGLPETAVVAYNDQLAIGLLRGLQARGVHVPGDVSVVGFDNIGPAELVTPALTTIAAPLRAEGAAAVRYLLAVLDGAEDRRDRPMLLPVRLVERASTARPGARGSRPPAGERRSPPGETPVAQRAARSTPT